MPNEPSNIPAVPQASPNPETFSLPLEILRSLHAASATRWEKRRDYEWKLSYAFWAALAGFIATVLFGKDAHFETPGNSKLSFWLVLIFACHAYYLWNMVNRTLGDLEAQSEIERAMNALSPQVDPALLGAGLDGKSAFAQRYGVWSQLGITVALCLAAWWFSSHHSISAPQPINTTPVTVICPAPEAASVPAQAAIAGRSRARSRLSK